MKKIILFAVIVSLLFTVILVYFYGTGINQIRKLNDSVVENIVLENLSIQKITNIVEQREINEIISGLKFDRWKPKLFWKIKLAPNEFMIFNGTIIGFFKTEKNYAKVEMNNGRDTYYFRIPDGVYEDMKEYIYNIK